MNLPISGRWLSILSLAIFIASANAEIFYVCDGGCPYKSIQDAVNAASDGDMISVESGTYSESVNLSKRLTLRGVDTGRGKPVIVNNSSVIILSANRSVVDGFVVSGSKEAGIHVLSWENTILGNDIRNNHLGIDIQSGGNIITGNNISDNDMGIMAKNESENIVTCENNCRNGNAYASLGNFSGNDRCEGMQSHLGSLDLDIYTDKGQASLGRSLPPTEAYDLMQENPGPVVIDVRTPEEYEVGRLEGATNLDYYSYGFRDDLNTLDKNSTYIIYCRSGYRGRVALEMMAALGFKDVHNISGGMIAWAAESMPMIGEVML